MVPDSFPCKKRLRGDAPPKVRKCTWPSRPCPPRWLNAHLLPRPPRRAPVGWKARPVFWQVKGAPNHLSFNTASILLLICPSERGVFLTEDSPGFPFIRAHLNPSVHYARAAQGFGSQSGCPLWIRKEGVKGEEKG